MADALPHLARYPRARLGHLPTPIDAAPRLSGAAGVEIGIKRDDCTGLAFGGNKIRQLEFYLGAARERGADCVLITGAVQSNFVRCAAAGARQLGMDIHIQLEERVPHTDEAYQRSGNVLLDRILGAHLHHYPHGEDESGADAALEDLAERLSRSGRRPYVVHLGIDHPPIGGLGYVVAARELAGQLASLERPPDALVVPSGSGLTHAGLLVGLHALGVDIPVVGVCVRRDADAQRARIIRRAREIAGLVGRADLSLDDHVWVTDCVLAPGYGQFGEETLEAISLAATSEGLLLDPVYSGKAMAGLLKLVRRGELARGKSVVFCHTGGQPALFGYEPMLSERLPAPGALD